jgi:hypothetical protein
MITRHYSEKTKPFVKMFYSPYSYYDFYEALTLEDINNHFTPYKINNDIIIYVAIANFSYDKLPSIKRPENNVIDYQCLEARGATLQEGFRLKKECE